MMYKDRKAAGRALAEELATYRDDQTVILALPRGGIEVAAEVAKSLRAPLGLVMVRKIGHPIYPEYAIGAVAEDIPPLLDENETRVMSDDWLERSIEEARRLNAARQKEYYGADFRPPTVRGKVAILVDDGIATGLTMHAAIQAVRQNDPAKIIVAVPVAPLDCMAVLERDADRVVVLDDPRTFAGSVGAHYRHFEQVNDEEVKTLLREVQHDIHQATTPSP